MPITGGKTGSSDFHGDGWWGWLCGRNTHRRFLCCLGLGSSFLTGSLIGHFLDDAFVGIEGKFLVFFDVGNVNCQRDPNCRPRWRGFLLGGVLDSVLQRSVAWNNRTSQGYTDCGSFYLSADAQTCIGGMTRSLKTSPKYVCTSADCYTGTLS
jgi:hypothetical protein